MSNMDKSLTIENLRTALKERKDRSHWDKGITKYALELLDDLEETIKYENFDLQNWEHKALHRALLNGAHDWSHFSWSGCSLAYDGQIARRLCTAYELKRRKNGALPPNPWENWLDVQARALSQAETMIFDTGVRCIKEGNEE